MSKPVNATSPGNGQGVTLAFVAKATLIVIMLWALAQGLWLARDVMFITFFALLIASFLSIFVEPLHDRGVPRAVGAPAVMFGMLLLLAAAVFFAWPTLRSQFKEIQQQLPPTIDRLEGWLDKQADAVMGSLGEEPVGNDDVGDAGGAAGDAVVAEGDTVDVAVTAQGDANLRGRISSELGGIVGGTLPLLNTAIGALTGLALVLIAGLFIAISPRTYMHGLIVLVPRSRRRRAGEVLPKAGVAMVQWMKGTALGMLVVGTVSALGLWLIGIPSALALGLLAGLLEFIPYVGPVLSFVPATIIGLSISTETGLWVLALYAAVQFVESNFLIPILMKKMVQLPPALTLLFQAVMATLFGFLGLLLAVPILAAVKVLVEDLYVEAVADES